MNKAEKIAGLAPSHVNALLNDMIEGGHKDNLVLLGEVVRGGETIQIQLLVTKDPLYMIDDHGCALHVDSPLNNF